MLGTLPQASGAADGPADADTQVDQAPVTPPDATPARNRDVAATAGAGAAIPATGSATPADARPPAVADARNAGGAADPTGSRADARGEAAEPGAPLAPASPLVFDDVRVLVADENNKGRERDAVLQFGNARVSVLERADGPSITSVPYKAVLGAYYSRSKQPKWKDADGNEVESKVDLGPLGFFRGERNWLILLTKAEPVIIRLDDSDLKTVLPAFTEHTGIAIQR
jgi:hypothetical protein